MGYEKVFDNGQTRLELYMEEEPLDMGLIGFVASDGLDNRIGIVEDQTPAEDRDYDYGCLTISQGCISWICMDAEVIAGLRAGTPFSEMILLHELGHYAHRHYESGVHDDRAALTEQGTVSGKEIEADAFVESFIGKAATIEAMQELWLRMKAAYSSPEYKADEVATSLKEVQMRIEILSNR